MHGADWEEVVDHDTGAIMKHDKEIGKFFHSELESLVPDFLLTGSKSDEFICTINPQYFEMVYGDMITKIGHGQIHLFQTGGYC